MADVDLSVMIPNAVSMEIDIATGAEVKAHADRILGQLGPDLHAIVRWPTGQKNGNAANAVGIDLGGPAMGKIWEVRKLVVVGADDHTAIAAAQVAFYVTRQKAGTAQVPPLTDIELVGLTVPSYTTLPRLQLQMTHQAVLIAWLTGAGVVAGASFTVKATVVEVDDDPRYLQVMGI